VRDERQTERERVRRQQQQEQQERLRRPGTRAPGSWRQQLLSISKLTRDTYLQGIRARTHYRELKQPVYCYPTLL
jgi:hypothetical protein